MSRTVKFRPDQPLFKADAFRMPLWVHAPFEIVRGIARWLTAALSRDNPHRDPLKNPTLTRGAKSAHRLSFWTGKPIVKGPKWRVIVRRWLMVFSVLASIKYLPVQIWKSIGMAFIDSVVWFVWVAIPYGWANLWVFPLVLGLMCLTAACGIAGFKALRKFLVNHSGIGFGSPWYVYVLAARDKVRGVIKR